MISVSSAFEKFGQDALRNGSEEAKALLLQVVQEIVCLSVDDRDPRPHDRLRYIRERYRGSDPFAPINVPAEFAAFYSSGPEGSGSLIRNLATQYVGSCRTLLDEPGSREILIRAFWIGMLARDPGVIGMRCLVAFGDGIQRLANSDPMFGVTEFRATIRSLDQSLNAPLAILSLDDDRLGLRELREIAFALAPMVEGCLLQTGYIRDARPGTIPPPSGILPSVEDEGPSSIGRRAQTLAG